jgi:hypothetical protein
MRNALLGLVVSAIVAAAPSLGRAEGRPTQLADHRPTAKDTALELELGIFTGHGMTTLAPHLALRYAAFTHGELVIDWPLEVDFASGSGGGGVGKASGNPSSAFYYMSRQENGYFRIGGGIGFPLAPASLFSLALNGLRDAWSYERRSLSLFVPAQLEIRRGALVLGGDLAGGVIIPTSNGGTTQIALQVAGMIGGRVGKTTLGTRLQGAWLPKSPAVAQFAIVPFVQADFNDGGFLYSRLTLNLDAPYGLVSGTHVWGLFVGGGSRM